MKQLEPRTVTVGENKFYIRPLPAFKAANLTGELAALVLPIVSGLAPLLDKVDSGKEGKGLMDLNIEDAAPASSGAFSALSGDKTPEDEMPRVLTEELANEVFCEDVQDMFLLAFEVIRTNYNGFFKKLGSRFGSLVGDLMKTAAPRQENMATLT